MNKIVRLLERTVAEGQDQLVELTLLLTLFGFLLFIFNQVLYQCWLSSTL